MSNSASECYVLHIGYIHMCVCTVLSSDCSVTIGWAWTTYLSPFLSVLLLLSIAWWRQLWRATCAPITDPRSGSPWLASYESTANNSAAYTRTIARCAWWVMSASRYLHPHTELKSRLLLNCTLWSMEPDMIGNTEWINHPLCCRGQCTFQSGNYCGRLNWCSPVHDNTP